MANQDTEDKNHPPLKTNPKPSLGLVDRTVEAIAEHVLKIPSIPPEERLAKLTDEQKQQLQDISDRAIREGAGQLDELEAALGMLMVGHHFGWKVLYLIHSKKTIRKYEEILDIKIRDIFPEKGPSSYRSTGLTIAEKYPNFWKIVSGDTKIPDRRKIE